MKLTTAQIKKLIKEELRKLLYEETYEENPLAGGASTETIRKAIGIINPKTDLENNLFMNYKTNYDSDQKEAEQIKAIADGLQKIASNALKDEENRDAQIFASALAQSLTNLADENDKEKLARAKTQIENIKAKTKIYDELPKEKTHNSKVEPILNALLKNPRAPKTDEDLQNLFAELPLVAKWYALAMDKFRKHSNSKDYRSADYVLGVYTEDPDYYPKLKQIAQSGDLKQLQDLFKNKGGGEAKINQYFGD